MVVLLVCPEGHVLSELRSYKILISCWDSRQKPGGGHILNTDDDNFITR